jgi:hypothetical protein
MTCRYWKRPASAAISTGHYYTRGEIESALEKPVVERLLELIRLRNSHPAFQGTFELARSADEVLDLRWRNDQELPACMSICAPAVIASNFQAADAQRP